MAGPLPLLSAEVPASRAQWRTAGLAFAVVLVWLLFWYRDTALAMVGIWERSDTFMHCFLIPPIVLWLIWRQRDELAKIAPRPDLRFLMPFAIVAFFWLLGELAAVNAITQLAFTGLVVLLVPVLLGWRVTAAIALPLAFLFFAVPIGEFIMPPMMEWTANFTVFALRLTGIPVYREGLQFVLPSGNWSVVEACSGIRYLIASVTVGTLFAYLNFHSLKRRLAFILVAILVPILANWLRAYGIVMLGHLSGNQLAVGVDHLVYGWLFFGVVILLMFFIGSRWADVPPPAGRAAAKPVGRQRAAIPVWLAVVASMLVTALAPLADLRLERSDPGNAPRLAIAEQALGTWRQAAQPPVDWRPAFQNPSAELRNGYSGTPGKVGLYLGYYRHQGYARKLVSSENMLVRSKDPKWAQVAKGSQEIMLGGQAVVAATAELRGTPLSSVEAESRIVVWQWYWVNGRLTSSDYRAKGEIALLRLLGRPDDSAVVILYAPKDQPGGAQAALQSFAQAGGGAIEAALQRTRGQP